VEAAAWREGDPFDALGDPHRRAIVELLASGARTVGEIADVLPISRPAVSRHLRLLKDAGLVANEPRGTRRLYRLHAVGVDAVRSYLMKVWGDAAAGFTVAAQQSPDTPETGARGASIRPAQRRRTTR
jgi:DNA-binding transcriptional ArsR family regulator